MKILHKYFANTLFIGKPAIFLSKCHSTNDIASELVSQEIVKEGTVVYTDHQISGRGQYGNVWESQPGLNLTFSVIFRPTFLRLSDTFHLNIFTSLSIFDFLSEYLLHDISIKWPNDLIWNEKKIAGILIENTIRGNKIDCSIIGIGVNVNQMHFEIDQAISIKQALGKELDRDELLVVIAAKLETRYLQMKRGEFTSMYNNYTNNLYWKDEVHVFKSDKLFNGIIRGVDHTGRLKVETDQGIRDFDVKEIVYIR